MKYCFRLSPIGILKIILPVLLIVFFHTRSPAQKGSRHYSETYYAMGAEVNPFPYISGGYSGSFWWGVEQVRFRGVVAYTAVPGFLVTDGFEQHKIRSYAILGDYFFDHAFKRLWVSGGGEYWQGSVINSNDLTRGMYKNYILTLGTGYVLKIWRNFYLNPSASIHIVVAGGKVVEVGNATFNSNTITPSLSLKIGYHFRL